MCTFRRRHLPGHPPEPLVPHLRRLGHLDQHTVAAGRPQPQLAGQLDGRPAVQGEQARVRQAGQELSRRLVGRRRNGQRAR